MTGAGLAGVAERPATLAEVIRDALDEINPRQMGTTMQGADADHIAAAVLAHLASDAVVVTVKEALLEAIQVSDGAAMISTQNPWTALDCYVRLDDVVRAALRAGGRTEVER